MDNRVELSEKDIWIKRIKNLAIDPENYRDGTELLALMDYYGVNNLMEISVTQLKEYYEKRCNRENRTAEGSTTKSS